MSGIIHRKLSELTKLENNPRYIKDEDFDRLCQSIKDNPDYFEARPLILSNRTGSLVIIAGNQRFEAAKKLGLKKVPTFLIENLTEEREREITIRDNVNNGSWDWDKLANEWQEIDLKNWGIDIPEPDPDDIDTGEADNQKEESINYSSKYGVIVMCKDEADQEQVYQKLVGEGYDCKIVVT